MFFLEFEPPELNVFIFQNILVLGNGWLVNSDIYSMPS